MRVLRVNEPQCPRCGRGRRSGFRYPSCAHPPEGMTHIEAHRIFCTHLTDDVCEKCSRDMRRLDIFEAS